MNILLGRSDSLALYGNDQISVVLDTDLNLIVESGTSDALSGYTTWEKSSEALSAAQKSLADRAISGEAEEAIIAAAGNRMYSIPDGVKKEAEKALKWRKEFKRGGTPVGLNTARTLAKGGQIGIRKVRHIAKYFPRHEVDKKGKGWDVGEDGYPSNGKIAWALWGGDPAWRWARAIVEREEKKALKASGIISDYDQSALESFKNSYQSDSDQGLEFMARVALDGTGMDRLYRIDVDGELSVWDENGWDSMGHAYADISSMDSELDIAISASTVPVTHAVIDPASAIFIASRLSINPFAKVSLFDIDQEEARLVETGLLEEDWELINRVMTAAGEPTTISAFADADRDGNYTPEERSENASEQPRDATGKFVKLGTRTIVANDPKRGSGVVESINQESGKVAVRLDSGKLIEVLAKYTTPEAGYDGPILKPESIAPLDLSGILAEPRTPKNWTGAQIPGTMKKIDANGVAKLLRDWPAFVRDMRDSFIPLKASANNRKLSVRPLIAAGGNLSPDKKDAAKYIALVSPDDPRAVMDLVVITPASKDTVEPMAYSYKDGKWEPDPQVLADIKSPTPPPIVLLDDASLKDVISQLSDETKIKPVNASADAGLIKLWQETPSLNELIESITAAGGLDRNRGNAEALRRYWTRGKGALKIRWNTPGDWTRCVRQLSKYMGPRAKGYCQLRHKEVTGVYTGDKKNVGKRGSARDFSTLRNLESKVIEMSALSARASDAREKVGLVASVSAEKGSSFYIPMLVPEGAESGDGRKFEEGAISTRDLPVPLLWQIKTGAGHDGSVVVGRIDYIERIEGGMGNAYGVFDTGPYGREAERLVRHGFLRGVSVDLDRFEAKEEKPEKAGENAEDGDVMGKDKLTITKARIMAATIVAKPAFQECSISLQNEGDQEETVTPEDGVYEESLEDFADLEPIAASGFLKQEVPMVPPAEWFQDPGLSKPTPLTIDEYGRIYGHIAAWNVSHIGLPRATKPPRSRTKYSYFHTGVLRTEDGKDVPVGQLTLAGGHAPLNATASAAAKHYDDTASAVADIHVGEDQYGIWCAGSIRPDLDEMQIRALRASAPSGDWRPINGSLELVAICQVNVPGFPTARAMVAGGKMVALVAAGASYMAMMRCQSCEILSDKAEMLGQLAATAPDLKSRVRDAKKRMREANLEALTASAADMREKALVAAAIAEMAKISQEERMKLAKKGHALPDGAYPIRNVEDLKNAIQAYGRSKASERRMVRKHIMKRARQLGKWMLVPEHWKNAASLEAAEKLESMRAAITAAASSKEDCGCDLNPVVAAKGSEDVSEEELKEIKDLKEEADEQTKKEIEDAEQVKKGQTPERDEDGREKYVSGVNQPRDAKGKYRKVLARLKQDLGVAGLSDVLKKVEGMENLDFAGDYYESANSMFDLLDMLDRLDTKALNPEALENVRRTAQAGGKTFANLPLPFGDENEKLKFSDLPADFKDLIDNMITRVEAKIGKEDADEATAELRAYMSGSDLYSQAEIQSQFSKMLRLLT